ncbi:MAG TPA: tetratricopeptide repeat protein, partial [Blastocatellia bacterium]|nr:tetratricopeptide repeat protein [Blastocatellia bacterium]
GEAIEQLKWCVRAGHRESVARYALGEIDLDSGAINGALEQLSQSVRLDPRDLKARTVLAVAERRAGKLDAALARIDEVVREAPIDYFALHEQYNILKARKLDAQAERVWTELWRLLAREPDALLELIFDYAAIGRAEAQTVAEKGFYEITQRQKKSPHPMLLYLLNSSSNQMAAAAAKIDPAYVFPSRVEEIAVLQETLKANPTDGRAAYYLGAALASKLRFKEALDAWRIAAQFDSKNAVGRRNYARALALVEDRKEEAAAALEHAIALAPDDHHLYLELDQLLAGMKQTERRVKLLEGAPEKARARTALLQSLAAAYADAGRFAEAVGLLERHTFTSGEGEGAALGLYRRAHLALAKQHQQAGRHVEAADAFIKATEYPANFGVGRPALQSQAREFVAAALEFEAAGRRNEAEKWLRRAAEDALNSPTQPEEPWSEHYYYKAVALDRLGRRDEARAIYERLARLNDEQRMQSAEPTPPRGALRFLLAGWGLKALGRNEEARAAFQRALQLDPTNDRAQAELDQLSR